MYQLCLVAMHHHLSLSESYAKCQTPSQAGLAVG